jgi:tetratricopeptide (TPR) repeat protein
MIVRVRFHLRRRASDESVPASALFVAGRDASAPLSICTQLGLDPSGRLHDVADGFLLRLDRPLSDPMPGAIRLRELSTDLYLPVDAELVPSLLDDEATGLVRDGGLVFLPGGRVLRFHRKTPVALESLLVAAPRPRREWRPMPEPPTLAERITEIAREWPEPPPEELYRQWEQDLRQPGSSKRKSRDPQRTGDGEGAGEGQATLGEAETDPDSDLMSGPRGLGATLKGLIGRAGSGARSIGEKLQWGMLDHSGLVQRLLREFRQGDPGRALRHAFPVGPSDPRDRTIGWGNQLPWSRAIYNLFDLLGRSSRGQPVATWRARSDLIEELKREYQKAAERATREGDFRRAAYIYGRLLNDHRMAAQALLRGGLHVDAAILFLKKLNDRAAAAQAFEAAGQIDRAIELYRQLGQHEAAGDLLRRIGDDGGALAEYLKAVDDFLESSPQDWYEAGRVLSRKVGFLDRAIEAYRNGWDRRPAANAAACALELIAIHSGRGEAAPLRTLLDQADAFYRSVGSARDARAFYERMMAATAAVPALAELSEDVRDRAMLALAQHVRRQVESGSPAAPAVSSLFGEPTLWSPVFVRDAQFAAASHFRSRDRAAPAVRGPRVQGVQVGRGTVTAACQVTIDGELFLGFADGKVLAFGPERNQVVPVGEVPGPVAALAADLEGELVVALRRDEYGAVLTSFFRQSDGSFRARLDANCPGHLQAWLTPILCADDDSLPFIGLGDGRELLILDASAGLPRARVSLAAAEEPPATALLLPGPDTTRILTHDGSRWILLDTEGRRLARSGPAWRPTGGSRSPRCSAPLSYTHLDSLIKVTGLDAHGAVHSSQLCIEDGVLEVLSSLVATTHGGYLAASQSGHSRVVAVSADRLDWLGYRTDRFQLVRTLPEPGLATTVACFPSTTPEEVLVVSADGFVARFEAPRRAVAETVID